MEKLSTNDLIMGVRDSNYLKWRFEKNPYTQYFIFTQQQDELENLFGYFIYFLDQNIAHIQDFYCQSFDKRLSFFI